MSTYWFQVCCSSRLLILLNKKIIWKIFIILFGRGKERKSVKFYKFCFLFSYHHHRRPGTAKHTPNRSGWCNLVGVVACRAAWLHPWCCDGRKRVTDSHSCLSTAIRYGTCLDYSIHRLIVVTRRKIAWQSQLHRWPQYVVYQSVFVGHCRNCWMLILVCKYYAHILLTFENCYYTVSWFSCNSFEYLSSYLMHNVGQCCRHFHCLLIIFFKVAFKMPHGLIGICTPVVDYVASRSNVMSCWKIKRQFYCSQGLLTEIAWPLRTKWLTDTNNWSINIFMWYRMRFVVICWRKAVQKECNQ